MPADRSDFIIPGTYLRDRGMEEDAAKMLEEMAKELREKSAFLRNTRIVPDPLTPDVITFVMELTRAPKGDARGGNLVTVMEKRWSPYRQVDEV